MTAPGSEVSLASGLIIQAMVEGGRQSKNRVRKYKIFFGYPKIVSEKKNVFFLKSMSEKKTPQYQNWDTMYPTPAMKRALHF